MLNRAILRSEFPHVNVQDGFLKVVGGKTESSNRRVWLTDRSTEILHRRLSNFDGLYLFPHGDQDGAGPCGSLDEQHRRASKRADVQFRLYDCRHTFATRALESGVDLLTLAAMLGHSGLDELRRYAHPSEERKREATIRVANRGVSAGGNA